MSMKQVTGSLLAAAASCLVWGASAQAADLGGNCCSDLEERIAELEATTARKGNRKVSLTISGWVNEAVFFWDDGVEKNTYVGTNDLERSRFKMSGEATIAPGWSAGYTLEIGIRGNNSSKFSEDASTSFANSLDVRKSNWFIKSKEYGKLTVGQEGTATYHLLDDADGANTRNYADAEAAAVALGSFRIVNSATGAYIGTTKWVDVMGGFNNSTPGQSGRRNVVRYDTPTIANFTASAAWGEDDMWDMALTYKGEVGDFKLVGKIGYGESTDPKINKSNCADRGNGDCQWWGAAGTVMHAPTGLYVYGGYGEQTLDLEPADAGLDDSTSTWFVQAGIERKFFPLGKTTVFGEYRNDEVGVSKAGDSSDLDFYAAGVVQNIENAAMDLYVIYRHAEGDFVAKGAATTTDLDSWDMVMTGARIQF
jgi:predicted porin